ncbi:MAG: DNA internalization-related competence protein ComEC/Rec2 [Acholeplasmatales bacterium]|nr:DNA internalization-related competence protein ComEC/Rec2 [Acholeplasmatales bacterium]
MKLLSLLKKKPFCNDLHFFLIAIVLLMISLKYYPLLILLFLYLFFIYKKTNLMIYISICCLIIISNISILKIIKSNNVKTTYEGYVLDIVDENNYIFKSGVIKILINDYNHNQNSGDILNVEVAIKENEKSYDLDFDYDEYLYSKGISYSAKIINKKFIKSGFSIYSLKNMYLNYLKNNLSEESFNYVNAIVFGNNNLESNIKDSYSILGLSHILAISGLHIIFLFKIISFLLLKIFHYYKDTIPLIILSIFIILIGSPISSLRALLFLILGTLNKKGNIYYTKLDILSISFIIMMIINPYSFYSIGFQLSFLVSFILIFVNDLIDEDNIIKRSIKSYLLIYFGTIPLTIKITGSISILSIFISPLLSSILGFIILPISYILSIFPILDYGLKYVFIFINMYIEGLSNYLPLIHIKAMNIYLILAYYLLYGLIIYSLAKNKNTYFNSLLLTIYLSIIIIFKYINPFASVTFINVGQGDSSLVRLPYNQGVVLVDAYNSYSYLKSEGIDRIDYLILTHSDDDHIGDYKEILNKIVVKTIIYPRYDERFDTLLKDYKNKTIVNYDMIINLNNVRMEILGPINKYEEVNSNSIVFKIKIFNKSFLFTGDMTEEEENDLINKYGNKLNSDILKVGHHGSNTSSSKLFLDYVSPDISIISVGKNNKYNLPNKEIVDRLNKISKVYMTKDRGNITFDLLNGNMWINTYR